MSRTLRFWLLAAALLLGQQAAQLHALSHLEIALSGANAAGKGTPATGHPVEMCVAFHAVDSALPSTACWADPVRIALPEATRTALPLARVTHLAFDSRAPPFLS
jgi:hypothetical protein